MKMADVPKKKWSMVRVQVQTLLAYFTFVLPPQNIFYFCKRCETQLEFMIKDSSQVQYIPGMYVCIFILFRDWVMAIFVWSSFVKLGFIYWIVFSFFDVTVSASGFIQSTLANVSHPLYHVVIIVVQFRLEDLQIANFEAGGREWNLEENREINN